MTEVGIEKRSVYLPKTDRSRSAKKKAMDFFECEVLSEKALGGVPCALADLSSLTGAQVAAFDKKLGEVRQVLVNPDVAAAMTGSASREHWVENRPLRAWAMAAKLREFRQGATAGDLCSLRLFWEWPKRLALSPKAFREALLPDLLDLVEHLVESKIQEIKVEPIGAGNAVFLVATLAGNVVAELSVSQALPNSLEPVRLLHAYFTKGALGNLPLYGYENDEGVQVADDRSAGREVCEHVSWDGKNEWDDFYLRMVGSLFDGTFGLARPGRQKIYQAALRRAWKSPGAVALENPAGGRP